MTTQLNSTKKLTKILLVALMLSSLVYSILPAAPVYAATYVVNDISDPAPGSVTVDGTCDINPGVVGDQCTLREAIMEANQVNDTDQITFDTGITNPIVLADDLPAIVNPLTINGTIPSGRVVIDGAATASIGFNIQASVSISNLVIINFTGTAVRVSGGADGVVINNNYIGMESDGSTDGQNADKGIRVLDSPNAQITNNLISGNDVGGVFASGAGSNGLVIQGNIIGLNAAKDARGEDTPTTGADGIRLVGVTNATIGGSGSNRNYISGNYGNGVVITGTSTGTKVNGNYVGVDGIGEVAIPNLTGGVRLSSASGVSIGTGAKNLISGNDATAIAVANSTDVTVSNNVAGLDIDGDTLLPNQGYGLTIITSSAVVVNNNVFSGNTGGGILINDGSTDVTITDNRIGVGEFTTVDLGNNGYGIYIDDSNDNMIGGKLSGDGNLIAYNDNDGIYVNNSDPGTYNSNGNAIVGNSIFSNGGLGIDLAPNNPTPNDGPGDPDTGPNTLQNSITFTAQLTATGLQIDGLLETDLLRPNYRLEFFINNSCDSSGYGEGQQLLDVYDLTIVAESTVLNFEIDSTGVSAGQYVTATVTYDEITGGLKDTSEFSPCAVVQEQTSPGSSGVFVVNSSADTAETGGQIGDGYCNVGGNVCTLRAALQEVATGTTPPYTITFSISGVSPHTINLTGALPAIDVPVFIKGKPSGYTGAPLVIVDGSGAGGNGLTINAGGTIVDGLSFVDFSGSAFVVNVPNVSITNNYIGLLADGTTVGANQTGINVNGTTNTIIRGNVISGNNNGIRLVGSSASNNTVAGNIIGLSASGNLDKGNNTDGVRVEGGSGNMIGGLSAADRNVISGNNGDGVEITGGASGNKVYGNYIGVGSNGTSNLANGGHGVNINGSPNNLVTYANIIAYNSGAGVYVANQGGNLISSNSIYFNTATGIQLASGGNNSIVSPTLLKASQGGSFIWVTGNITGASPNTQYTLEFFVNPSGSAQGETFVLAHQVTTNGSGNATYEVGLSGTYPDLTLVTANMRDSSNNTSAFSGGVYVINDGTAPTLTNTPTFTPLPTNTPTPTDNLRPTFTFTYTPTNTSVPANTTAPTATTSGGGGGGGATVTLANTSTPTITETPTITPTPTLLSQYQTLTQLAAENTIDPTSTPETPTLTKVADNQSATETAAAALTLTAQADGGGGGDDSGTADDGSGGGGQVTDTPTLESGTASDLTGGGGDNNLMWILIIFIGLAVLLLIIGGGMELMRWMNSRE